MNRGDAISRGRSTSSQTGTLIAICAVALRAEKTTVLECVAQDANAGAGFAEIAAPIGDVCYTTSAVGDVESSPGDAVFH